MEDPRRRARHAERRRRKLDGARGYEPVRRPVVEARPCETCGREIPPERLGALPDATRCLDCKRSAAGAPGRSWNLGELERLAREHGGRDVAQDEERRFLLLYLAELADGGGNLSADFDALIRESFLDAVSARR